MKMRFRRKKLLDQINTGLESLNLLGLNEGTITYPVPSRGSDMTKEVKHIGNGAYVVRTWTIDSRSNHVFSDLSFTVSKDTFTSSEGYSTDTMESLASLFEAIKRSRQKRV